MAANSPENPVPMITVSTWRGCIGLPAYAGISSVADCSDALIFGLLQAAGIGLLVSMINPDRRFIRRAIAGSYQGFFDRPNE
jgi:hypothetical protein